MISSSQKQLILEQAYVPEHSVELMRILSGSEPWFLDGFFFCLKPNHIVLIGYPLERVFTIKDLQDFMAKLVKEFSPRRMAVIAPELPPDLNCRDFERDQYYVLKLCDHNPSSRLFRVAQRALGMVQVELSRTFTTEHNELTQEFLARIPLPSRVSALYKEIHSFIEGSPDACLISAWANNGKLAAFLAVDLAPHKFSVYVLGCHSKKNYVKWASDLLFSRMIELSIERGKTYIHLGLGVNDGIRQFKRKWGGVPDLSYNACELTFMGPSFLESIYSFFKGFR